MRKSLIVKQEKDETDRLEREVIEHDRDRRQLHRRLRERNIKNAYVTFAGPLIRHGYSVTFFTARFAQGAEKKLISAFSAALR